MTRSLLALTALLLGLSFTASEAPLTRTVEAESLSRLALIVETVYTSAQQTEKHFLPVDELSLALTHAEFVRVSLFAPAFPTIATELNIRGPPSIRA